MRDRLRIAAAVLGSGRTRSENSVGVEPCQPLHPAIWARLTRIPKCSVFTDAVGSAGRLSPAASLARTHKAAFGALRPSSAGYRFSSSVRSS